MFDPDTVRPVQPPAYRTLAIRLLNYGEFDPDDPSVIAEVEFDRQPPVPYIRQMRFELRIEGGGTIACRPAEVDHFSDSAFRMRLVPAAYNGQWKHPEWTTVFVDAQQFTSMGRSWVADVKEVAYTCPNGWNGVVANPFFVSRSKFESAPPSVAYGSIGEAAYASAENNLDFDTAFADPSAPKLRDVLARSPTTTAA